jgi:hypothetical protein
MRLAKYLVGKRVRLLNDVERFPHGIVEAGAEGTIVSFDRIVAVKLDEHHEWLDEWDNELHWYPENAGDVSYAEDLEVID